VGFSGSGSTVQIPSDPFFLTIKIEISHPGVGSTLLTSYNSEVSVTPVPEPSALLLLGAGLAVLGGFRLRKK
jgi:hypothetical protein